MEASQEKYFSVIVRLNKFAGLNGELAKITNEVDREKYIKQFFLDRYGKGNGKLDLIQKKSKVKLKWYPSKIDQEAEAFHKTALTYAKNKNYTEAVNNWIKAISVNSQDPDYYFNLGIAFFELRNFKESIENLKKTLAICPIYYKSHLILGTLYLKMREFENAERHLIESIDFCPDHALAYLNLGAVYSILRRYDEGIRMFLKTLELSPNELRAYFGLGKIFSIKGDVNKANQYFKKVIDLDPQGYLANHAKRAISTIPAVDVQTQNAVPIHSTNIENLYQEGYKAFLYSDYKRAVQMYRSYLTQKQDDDFVWSALGETLLRVGDVTKALEAFKKAAAINSNKGLYYKQLAIAFDYLGNDNELLDSLSHAKRLGKNDSTTLMLWGKLLMKQQKIDEAIAEFEQAIKLNPNNLQAKFQLALAYLKKKDMHSALIYLQEVKQAPSNTHLKMEAETIIKKCKA